MTIFIREACQRNGRYSFRPIRFPFARFDRRHLRTSSPRLASASLSSSRILSSMDSVFAMDAHLCRPRNSTDHRLHAFCRFDRCFSLRHTVTHCLSLSSLAYLLPAMRNRNGQRFSIAQLLERGYASFTDRRSMRSGYFNIRRYAHEGNGASPT